MRLIVISIISLVLPLTSACNKREEEVSKGGAKPVVPKWEPVAPGTVITRNFMVPRLPQLQGYRMLPKKYHLGSKAYAKAPPDWWLKMIGDSGMTDKWHAKDFPLAYAGEIKSKAGTEALLVVQVSQAFSGDGFYSPGPEIYCVARLFSSGADKPKLLKEQTFSLGSMQYNRLLAGVANDRQIVFKTEGGRLFDDDKVAYTQSWTLTVGEDNSLSMTKGETDSVDK